ncbi:hypothetical protein CBL_01154 [Carabus blaptoides fortunei]
MGCSTLLRIERFCCCSTLRIGSFIIGYLGLMSHSIQVVAGSVQLAYFRDQYYLAHRHHNNNNTITIYDSGHFYMLVAKYMSVIIAYNVSLALASASLIWGIHKRKSEFMLPWLIFQVVNFCSVSLIMLVGVISFAVRLGVANGVLFFILGLVAAISSTDILQINHGALVIGYLNITSAVFSVISTIAQLASPTDVPEQLKIAITVTLVLSCITLLVNSLMVYGVHEGKPGFLIAWLVLKLVVLLVVTVFLTGLCGQVLLSGADGHQYAVIFVVIPLTLALAWYLFLVVYSHYKELCDGPSHSRLQNKYYCHDQIAIVSEKDVRAQRIRLIMVQLQSCCCCSLRVGSLVIGFLNITYTLPTIILTIRQLTTAEWLKFIPAIMLTILCLILLVNLLMIYGVLKDKPGFIFAWLAFKFLCLVISTILVIISSGQVLMRGAHRREYVTIFLVIPLMLALSWYLYLVVYSYYNKLCDDLRALVIGYLNIVSIMCFLFSTIVHLASTTYQNEHLKTVCLTVSFLDLLVVSIMVYGVHRGKPSYLFAWLALDFLGLSASTVLVTILSGQVLLKGTDGPQYAIIFVVMPLMLGSAWYLTGCLIIGYLETAGNVYGIINSLITSESFEEIILFVPISIFLMLINIFLICGVYMEKKKLLLPWIISKFLFYLVITSFFVMRLVETFFMIPDFIEFKYKIFVSFLAGGVTVLVLLAWHSFLCIYSFYSISTIEIYYAGVNPIIGTAGWLLTVAEIIGLATTISFQSGSETKEIKKDDEFDLQESSKSHIGYEIGYAVITFIICALLIWGIYKRDKRFMLPWLILKCIENILGLLVVLFLIVLACAFVKEGAAPLLVFAFIMLGIVALFCYAWICVWSHYMELSEGVAPAVYYHPTTGQAQGPPPKGSQMT